MQIYHSLEAVPYDPRTAITIGTFDGVHRGHRLIVDALIAGAREIGGRSLVLTFHPHPQEVLRKRGDSVPVVTTIEERIEEFSKCGVDGLIVLEFTPEMADTHWRDFCEMLMREVGLAHIVVGHDHAFGKNREGTAESLRGFGRESGFGVTEIGPLIVGDEAISSTKIRRAILAGDLEKANDFLGRPFSLKGRVVTGDGRGRTIGIPTANIEPLDPTKIIPSNGVYGVKVNVDSRGFQGMANIGNRPSFTDGATRTIEAHLFDFNEDIYNNVVTVEFRKFVRSEQKFSSVAEFLQQLEIDRRICQMGN